MIKQMRKIFNNLKELDKYQNKLIFDKDIKLFYKLKDKNKYVLIWLK